MASAKVIGALSDRIVAARHAAEGSPSNSISPVVLLSGSLGSGGAERQFVNTAVGLCGTIAEKGNKVSASNEAVIVIAKSLRDRVDGNFFLPELQRAGVTVKSYQDFPDFNGDLQRSVTRPLLPVLRFLPWAIAEGIIKLSDLLRAMKPQVVHIWQDGLIYSAGLAALLGGVPRIILSPRSVPPPDRRKRYLVEYEIIYRSLMSAPGVALSLNSKYAAKRYAEWLGINPSIIKVIPNGVSRLPIEPDETALQTFRSFHANTAPSSFTLGAVMRMDDNKQPLLWIECAARILEAKSDARFILVGDGPLRAKAMALAEARGLGRRCLFTGRSSCVGFWLSKMTVLMLLSEQEGLPNALIEAQLLRVPVITSPAGGAAETLLPGITGILTSKCPRPAEVVEIVTQLTAEPDRLGAMGIAAEKWAAEAFPVDRMLASTLELYQAAGQPK